MIVSHQTIHTVCLFSEKSDHEAKLARHLIVHIIQSLTDIIEENMKRNEKD